MVKYVTSNKTYYKAATEFIKTTGTIFTEFDDEIATRQISIVNDKIYISSSLTDWNDAIGYLLYDGEKSELDLSDSTIIDQETFESFWRKGLKTNGAELSYQTGNAAEPLKEATIIAHVANNLGKWGKGFVLALSKAYPSAEKEYKKWFKENVPVNFSLGRTQFVEADSGKRIYVANMVAQDGIRTSIHDKKTYLDYNALADCLDELKDFALKERLTIQMPRIGAGLGGGDWERIEALLLEHIAYYKISCTILSLE
jgi:O-acetyl-ADP-ribose deacetylase (regulator of RNase III)